MYKLNLEIGKEGTPQSIVQSLLKEWNLILESSVFIFDGQICKEDITITSLKPVLVI